MKQVGMLLAMGLMASVQAAPSYAATTVDWSFTGTHDGSGKLTYDTTGVVTALTGTYNGQNLSLISFTNDPNNPGGNVGNPDGNGNYTYHGAPNTGGVDYIFDNRYPLTASGLLVSTGMGASERVYNPSLAGNTPDFFSVNSDGSYVDDFGTFATTPVSTGAVPEPATWAMMLVGFGAMGFAMRRRRNVKTTVSYAV